jgi:hypothetical protein
MTIGGAAAASGQQRRDVFAAGEDRAPEALRLAWGDAYDISFEDGRRIAISRDAEARVFTADTPGALNLTLRAGWAHEGTP